MPHRILLVDDNTTNLQVLFQALSPEGYELLVAQSGEQALEVVAETKPGLVLLDIKMPGIDGIETFKRMRANPETDDIPVLFLSAHATVETIAEVTELGAEGYLTKPFQFDDVVAKVRELLGESGGS